MIATNTPLTPEQKELCQQLADQYPRLYLLAWRIFPKACNALQNRGYENEDIETVAWLGAINAVKRFDPERKVKLSTYAAHWIRASLSHEVAYFSRVKHGGREKIVGLKSTSGRLHGQTSGRLTWDKIADRKLFEHEIQEETEHEMRTKLRVRWALDELDKRAKDIIEMRFGINGYSRNTLEEIAKKHGVTKERIRQIESKSIEKLKPMLESVWQTL